MPFVNKTLANEINLTVSVVEIVVVHVNGRGYVVRSGDIKKAMNAFAINI